MADLNASTGRIDWDHADTPLVGRARELTTLVAMLDRVSGGEGSAAAVVVGEAGIGKTSLLDRLRCAAVDQGALVLTGRAAEFERELPYAAAIDALGELDHQLDASGPAALRHLLHRRVGDLLAARSIGQPVLLCIDDAHWADSGTIDLLTALLHRQPVGRVLTVIAYRQHQRGSAITAAFQRAAASRGVVRIEVAPLGLQDAVALLPTQLTIEQVKGLHAACGGNPFYLRHLAARQDGDSLRWRDGVAGQSDAIRTLLRSELDPLSAAARRLLTGAAVVGDPFDLGVALTTAELELAGEEALAVLDELVGADLVRQTSAPHVWAFRHPLIRSTVYRAISPGTRLIAHTQAAAALRAAGATELDIARHVEQSAQVGDVAALEILRRAGEQAATRSPRSAAHWLQAAWRLVPHEHRAQPRYSSLLYAASVALAVSGQDAQALEIVHEASGAFPPDHTQRAGFELWFALIETTVGRRASARTRLLSLAASLGSERGPARVGTSMALAQAHLWAGDHSEAAIEAAGAVDLAESLGGGRLLAAAESVVAWVAYVSGDLDTARHRQQTALARFDAMDDATASLFPMSLAVLARTSWGLDRVDDGARIARRGLAVTRNGSWPILVVQFLTVQALCERARGVSAIARDAADQAIEAAALIERDETLYWSATVRASMLEPTSQLGDAAESAEEALQCARKAGVRELTALAGQLRARVLLGLDRPACAADVILNTHGGVDLTWLVAGRRAASYALLTEAELRRDNAAAAELWARRARASAEATRLPLSTACADVAQARVMLAVGDASDSARLLSTASAALSAAGLPFDGARVDLLRGEALIACGLRDDAVDTLRHAESIFASCGADRLQAATVRLLRSQGRRVTRSGRTVPVGVPEPLTGRQREVAELAAGGASNPEIARALFVSVKTVETHLSKIFVKLGVSSRAELGERLRTVPAGAASVSEPRHRVR